MPFVWLGAAVLLGLFEAAAPGLICIWFCLGAVASFIASLFVGDVFIQIIVFVAVSLVALLALRPLMKKRVNAHLDEVATNADAYVGRDVVVTQAIPDGQRGRARLADVTWNARTVDGQAMASGTHARVASVDGTVLVLEPLP